ncbi:Hypothetical_protein [Hexamita inflata]|uniref:Hypothetical_protein n=1 Tax=Hexamita inflata TaxID=28002 RepID=A0AA86TSW0_9EUKA|nr:Hypothetical protein HINF_LOCUS8876 [Hexamita inflata]CAI9925512.1 Hypothetical protein HINF_LOCUS13157 [Hexamita inflata]
MKLFEVQLQEMSLQECTLLNKINTRFKAGVLRLSKCSIRSSQLQGVDQINRLYFESDYRGNGYYNECIVMNLQTIIEDIPNLNFVSVSNCVFRIKTYAQPVVKCMDLKIFEINNLSFKFFQNVETLKISNATQSYNNYTNAKQQFHERKLNNKKLVVDLSNNINCQKYLLSSINQYLLLLDFVKFLQLGEE